MWLSEIILQQTRVDQGLQYYINFVRVFPTIRHLANAPEKEVLKLWQGLGYYSRARNLHITAKKIIHDLNGKFPKTYPEILKLKGVGPYTAAAIASICFDEPRPVVDGNVFRFASRYFMIKEDIAKARSRKIFENVLTEEISRDHPGDFNQAVMEYGATICTFSPKCDQCVFFADCQARTNDKHLTLPIRSRTLKIKNRRLNYLVLYYKDKYILRRRSEKDIWRGLYDFFLIENAKEEEDILNFIQNELTGNFLLEEVIGPIKHTLSHQHINATFYKISVPLNILSQIGKKLNMTIYSMQEMLSLPKSKLIVNYIRDLNNKS